MALIDDVQKRIPEQVLIEASGPRDSGAEEINLSKLAQAAASVEVRIQMYAEETYDADNDYHVELAVHGVVGLLDLWGSGDPQSVREFWEWFKGECQQYRDIGPRARIQPQTNSPLQPSDEDATGERQYPWADDREFRDILFRRGSTGTDDPDIM